MRQTPTAPEPSVGALVRDIVDGLGALVATHFKLLRAELVADARDYGRRAVRVSLSVALALLGYAFVCIAAALALARAMGAPLAFLAVGGTHVAAAAVGLRFVLKQTPGPPLGVTRAELDQTMAVFSPERSAHAPP
jgi:putative superfamily III holin-X